MSARTIVHFLSLCLVVSACKRVKETPPPPPCNAEHQATAACEARLKTVQESLDACVQRPGAAPLPAEASSDDSPVKIKTGGTYVLLQGDQVVVMNERGIRDQEWTYPYASACRVDP